MLNLATSNRSSVQGENQLEPLPPDETAFNILKRLGSGLTENRQPKAHQTPCNSPSAITYQKVVNGKVVRRFSVSAKSSQHIDDVLGKAELVPEHGNCRAVMVVKVDQRKYQKRIRDNGARPIKDDNYNFPSATAASQHFGYRYNAVAIALAAARRRGEDTANVGGLSVRWADEVGGIE